MSLKIFVSFISYRVSPWVRKPILLELVSSRRWRARWGCHVSSTTYGGDARGGSKASKHRLMIALLTAQRYEMMDILWISLSIGGEGGGCDSRGHQHFLQSPAQFRLNTKHNGGGIHFQPRDRDSTRCQSAQPMVGQQKSPQVMERRRCTGHCTRQIRRGRVPQTSHLPTIPFKLVRTTPTQHDHASLPRCFLAFVFHCSSVSHGAHDVVPQKTTTPRNPTTQRTT